MLSDDELKDLKDYVEKSKAAGIPFDKIREALLKVGWEEYLIDLVMHDVDVPHEDMEKVLLYVRSMKELGKGNDAIRENLRKAGWQSEVIDKSLAGLEKRKK